MFNPREFDMLSLFIFFIVIPLVTYFLLGICNENSRKKERIDLIAQQLSEESDQSNDISVVESTVVPLANPPNSGVHLCANCFGPASTRCSRCKSVRYCSGRCQISHWRLVHKLECHILGSNYHGSPAASLKPIEGTPLPLSASSDTEVIALGNSLSDKKSVEDDGTVQEEKSMPGDCPTSPRSERNDADIREGEFLVNEHNADGPTGAGVQKSNSSSGSISFETAKKTDDESRVATSSIVRTVDTEKLAEESRVQQNSEDGPSRERKLKMIFPYEEFVNCFQMEISDSSLSPRGFVNCGNSCYANVVLQCLAFTKPLTVYLLRRSHSRAGCSKSWCLMCELERLVTSLRKRGGPLSPANILTHIRSLNSQIGDGSQEDAHEFLRLLVASMQTISLEAFGGEKHVEAKMQETTFIQHMFGGCLQSKVKCLNCNHESLRCENMMDLTLEILDHVESLEGALAQFTSLEYLDGENMYRCLRCAAYVRAQKQLKIQEAPNMLTIVLKRFQGNNGKNNKSVTFPEFLDVVPFMTGTEDIPPLYVLYGVIVHLDSSNASSSSGHYISYVKDMHGNWFKADDSEVKPVKVSRVMSQGAYILFYIRSHPRVLTGSKPTRRRPVDRSGPPRIQMSSRLDRSNVEEQPNINTRLMKSDIGEEEYDTNISSQVLIRESRSSRPSICRNYAEFSDRTPSDWSARFTSSDDSSPSTESARDSFCTVESTEIPFCSVYRSLYHSHNKYRAISCCSTFPRSRVVSAFAHKEMGVVVHSSVERHCFRGTTGL